MNKRSSPRFAVSVDATISFADGTSRVCAIRDYCSGGIYMLCHGGEEFSATLRGQSVRIEFSDPLMPRAAQVRIETKVMRVESHGLGLAFVQENIDAVVALSQLAAKQAAKERGELASASDAYGQATVNELVTLCQRKSEEYVPQLLKEFLTTARNDLFEAANMAGSNAQQSAYFAAMNELRKAQQTIDSSFRKKIGEQFTLLSEPGFISPYTKSGNEEGGLTLLDSSELDHWLAVRSMATRLEEFMGETLEALEKRLEAISVNPVNTENNPVGPFVLAAIFREELERLTLEAPALQILFDSINKVLGEGLKHLYDELNESLIARGVLPTLAKKLEVVRQQSGRPSAARPRPESYGEGPVEPGYEGTPDGGGDGGYVAPPSAGGMIGGQGATWGMPSAGNGSASGSSASAPSSAGSSVGTAPQASGGNQNAAPGVQTASGAAPMSNGEPPAQAMGGNQNSTPAASAAQANGDTAPQGGSHAAGAVASDAPQAGSASPAPAPVPTQEPARTVQYTRGAAAVSQSAGRSREASGPAPAAPFHGVQELMRMQQPVFPAGAPGPDGAPTTTYSSGQVLQAISRMGEQLNQIERGEADALEHIKQLSQALLSSNGDPGMVLSDTDRDAIAYVGGLFSSIHHDPYLSAQARPWFERLEVPMLKAGILDNSLLEDDSHPARLILNRLERIADRLEGNDSAAVRQVHQEVEKILDEIPAKVEEDPDVFATALSHLHELEQEVEGSYEENIKKLIAECEREQLITKARNTVLAALNDQLGHREVPLLVLNLLDIGWKNLLLRTLLKNGKDSVIYKTYLSVIDQLSAGLTGGKPHKNDGLMSHDKLLEWIERMMAIISNDEAKNKTMLAQIASHLSGSAGERATTRKVVEIASKSAAQASDAQRPEEVSDDVWELMLEDVRQLEDRESFRYTPEEGEGRVVNLVWEDEDEGRYVFANSLGLKALDLHRGQVANHLYGKQLVRMGEKEISITERATYSFLQNLHNQLAFQANHDALTGLLSRKAFEAELEQACSEAAADNITHVLAYMDLDRFNIVNTTCGHADGDVLLGKVAGVIKDTLTEEAIIARLGGDEFGMLLKKCSRTKGLMLITKVHDNLRKMRFSCQDNEFKITASMGVSEISANSESGGHLLSAVDSATFTAKENGRDNIQIHNRENERISSRRTILDWVGRINVLFEKDLIQLRCQKIVPLHRTVNSLPHYEILLDVYDEEGNKVPLDEFIVAAERYNRITDIDTWVVDKVFNWLEEHKAKLDRISNLSINLSGVSIGNRHFMDEVLQRMNEEGFPSDKVCFEVTESIAISNIDNAARFMTRLKETGCRFSLDDFGKGTSSYAYLRSLPIDYVKIDGAFVREIATNAGDYAVVKSINEIAHVMGKQTIAEYVEDDFAYEALRAIGLDFVQGFGVEKPIPLSKLFG